MELGRFNDRKENLLVWKTHLTNFKQGKKQFVKKNHVTMIKE